jgi:acetoacetyl-CoA synthetase
MNVLWKFAQDSGMTTFGTSASYLTNCMKMGVTPGKSFDLSKLVSIGSTGSPLPPEGFAWVYEEVKRDLWLASASGGTDVCSAFLTGCPILPVRAGELQCRVLGGKVQAFDEEGHPVVNEVGELVITTPMPSMPLYFWNDPGNTRYEESYFAVYPGIWRHGDWIKITPEGSAIIYGRSDSTINRMGVRMGSSELYTAIDAVPEVLDSLIVGVEQPGGGYYMPLFVVLRPGFDLDERITSAIRQSISRSLSPRFVPDEIVQIAEVPRTLSGKKLEVPVKKLLMGMSPEKALNIGAVGNPAAVEFFIEFARKHLERQSS